MTSSVAPPGFTPRACPACGCARTLPALRSEDFMLGLPGTFSVHRCAECGLLFQNPAPSPEALSRHYPDDYAPYSGRPMRPGRAALRHLRTRRGYGHLEAVPGKSLPVFGRLWDLFEDRIWGRFSANNLLIPGFVPGGSLLEIACASGERLEMLRGLGWAHCIGIELNAASAARARAKGFEVHAGSMEETLDRIPDASLDVVIAGFVLEHLENPFEALRRIARKLRPGGQLLISTLRVDSPDFRLFGRYWYNLDLPRHFTFFRKRDLVESLASLFQVEAITHQPAPNDYVGSARYRASRESRRLDRVLLNLKGRIRPLCALLALTGNASRIVLHCRRRSGD